MAHEESTWTLPTTFATIDEKDEAYQEMTKVELLLEALGDRTLRNFLLTYGEYPGQCLAQTKKYPKRGSCFGSEGCGRTVLHGIIRTGPARIDCQYHDRKERLEANAGTSE